VGHYASGHWNRICGNHGIRHTNAAAHPPGDWTLRRIRGCLAFDDSYEFVIHDTDATFLASLDSELKSFGLRVLNMPVRAPKANAHCERLIGTIRRKSLDYLIPINERHLV
jgi:hypothetical protein